MIIGRYQLEVDILCPHELFQSCGALVVELLEAWFEAAISDMGVQLGIGTDQLVLVSGFDGLGKDSVGVIVIQDHDIFVTFAGDHGETTRLICKNLSRQVDHFGIH